MSSYTSTSSHSVDAQAQHPREEADLLSLDTGQIQRTDSLPSTLAYTNVVQEISPNSESQESSEALTASAYPLIPTDSIPNTPSPRSVVDDKFRSVNTEHEIEVDDNSGSSHTSAEGVEPTSMAFHTHSPHVNISHWAEEQSSTRHAFAPDVDQYREQINTDFKDYLYSSQNSGQNVKPTASRTDEGLWRPHDTTGLAGLDPESRWMISDAEIPNLKEQEEQRHILETGIQVDLWRQRGNSLSDPNAPVPGESTPSAQEGVNLESLDAASIRENRLLDGQVYYNIKGEPPIDVDLRLMCQPRQFNDAPALPYMTVTNFQAPETANDAIQKWMGNAETFSVISRAATWGTRRRSEPSLKDIQAVADGSFLKKLSIKQEKKGSGRWHSISNLGQRAVTRVRSNSNITKRSHRASNLLDDSMETNSKQNNLNNLAPPPRSSSLVSSKKPMPSLNTAIAAMAGTVAAVGTGAHHPPHTRNGSLSAVSPKSPLRNLPFLGPKRSRSKSDLSIREGGPATSVSAIGELWKMHGGPPVPTLASRSFVEPESTISTTRYLAEPVDQVDQVDQDDEDDEQGDESDMKMKPAQSEPIVPTYEGFKEHVRRLDPDMDPKFHWLVSRIAHQLEIRYKNLLDQRVKHLQCIMDRNCSSRTHCVALGGSATLFDAQGKAREDERSAGGLQLVTDFSDDSNPGDGALTSESFPKGVPLPPTRDFPAEFECQLCFKAKRFHKPSDWTKHVHEDAQPFTCTFERCRESISFKRKADWVRHENERHRHLEWWVCQMGGCNHACNRKDNFLQHLVREHKLPEPKHKTKAAIKKAREYERAWVMLDSCHRETTNKPQEEPCKFCGKSFTTWKKLTAHLAKHMESISLPVLQLVEQKNVDADTIISPVEQNLTPITPLGRSKLEDANALSMEGIAPNMPMVPQFSAGFHQPAFYPKPGPSTPYSPVAREASIGPFPMFSNSLHVQQMNQPRQFDLDHMHHALSYDASADTRVTSNQVDQSRSDSGTIDARSTFTPMGSNPFQMQSGQKLNPAPHSAVDFSMTQAFVATSLPVPAYQTPNMLGVTDLNTFGFDALTAGPMTNFHQVPMRGARGSSSSCGQPPQHMQQHSPPSMQYYGHP